MNSDAAMSEGLPAPASELGDEDLMRRVQTDDALAFEELYDRYSATAFSLARVICESTEDAQDAVQEGFLNAWRNRARYDQARGSPKAWVLALIRYRSIDTFRRHRNGDGVRASDDYLQMLPAPHRVEADAIQNDEANRLRATLQQLPALQREVIVLAYFGGLTHTEIGNHLHLPRGTGKGRMRLGLRRILAETGNP